MGQLAKGVKAKGGGEWGRALLIGLFLLLRWVLFLLFRVVPRQGTGEGLRRIIVVASEGGPLLVFTHHAVTDIVLKMQMGLTDGIRQTASGVVVIVGGALITAFAYQQAPSAIVELAAVNMLSTNSKPDTPIVK